MAGWVEVEPLTDASEWRHHIDAGAWFEFRYSDDPSLRVRLRLGPGLDGVPVATAICVERKGVEVGARDLRRVQLRQLLDRLRGFVTVGGPVPSRPVRPGPKGHSDEHWRRVWDLYREARDAGARSYIKWMRERWEPPVPDATMRRWKQRAEQVASERGWEQ